MRGFVLSILAMLMAPGCATVDRQSAVHANAAIAVAMDVGGDGSIAVRFDTNQPVAALHFAQALGQYRPDQWQPAEPGWRWVVEGEGERVERIDGLRFDTVTFRIPLRYQVLPKSYAPFSPFSDGGALIYTGQFHACIMNPCAGVGPLPIAITATGSTLRVPQRTATDTLQWRSSGEGTNIYVGNTSPITAGGLNAIIDPLLTGNARTSLEQSLPASMTFMARHYGRLTFTPMLFISIDARPRPDGNESTQGGTLPGQIFMHFDGANARERVASGSQAWLQWFFAHEVAHLFQRDNTGDQSGDATAAWMHEGGADALAALALLDQGDRAYVRERLTQAGRDCDAALALGPLTTATSRDAFDAHYSCGLVANLALDGMLSTRRGSLHAFNRALFSAVSRGAPWSEASWFTAAARQGVSGENMRMLRTLVGPDPVSARGALVDALRIAASHVDAA